VVTAITTRFFGLDRWSQVPEALRAEPSIQVVLFINPNLQELEET